MPFYNRGDKAAYLEPDPEGTRIYEAEITSADGMRVTFRVGIDTEERWANVNEAGYALAPGEPKIVPFDEVLAQDLANNGDGFLVRPTMRDAIEVYESVEEKTAQIQARMERWTLEQRRGYGY